jgi:hypothetical protein
MQMQLMNRMAEGYLLTEMKFLKSFKSLSSSVSDLESDFSYLRRRALSYLVDFIAYG